MTPTVRLPQRVEQDLVECCAKRRLTKSEAVKLALEELAADTRGRRTHFASPFHRGDKGDGSDVSGGIKAALRGKSR